MFKKERSVVDEGAEYNVSRTRKNLDTRVNTSAGCNTINLTDVTLCKTRRNINCQKLGTTEINEYDIRVFV